MITAAQIRAARALLGWRQIDLAKASELSEIEIKNLEAGLTNPRSLTIERLLKAFGQAGVVFFGAGEVKGDGPGVRFKNHE